MTSQTTRPIVVEVTYAVDPATVWAAITDPERMARWYFEPIEDFRARVGHVTRFTIRSGGKDYAHVWRVIEAAPPERLAYTFDFEGIDSAGEVLWELTAVEGGTRLMLTHTGLETYPRDDPAFKREAGVAGWKFFLEERLKRYLEPDA